MAVKIIGREAGESWKNMSAEQKEPYETLSTASKAEYARMKLLTPAERIMVLAAQAMHHPVSFSCAHHSALTDLTILGLLHRTILHECRLSLHPAEMTSLPLMG